MTFADFVELIRAALADLVTCEIEQRADRHATWLAALVAAT